MIKRLSLRQINFVCFLICSMLSIFAFCVQYIFNVQPCLLCIIQRILFITMAIVFLIATLHNPKRRGLQVYGWITLLVGLLGIVVAGHQVLLQMSPSETPQVCVPGFSYILSNLSIGDAIKVVLRGTPDCSKIGLTFFGFSMAVWSLFFYIILVIVSVMQIKRANHS